MQLATRTQRYIHRRCALPSSSQFKGVTWHKRDKHWAAQICHNNKRFYIGGFHKEEEAALAYDQKATELFGEHAYLNFPPVTTDTQLTT